MTNKWDIPGTMNLIEQRSDDFTLLAADIVLGEVITKTPEDRGGLRKANDKRHVGPSHYQVFNDKIYAAQREYGGVIKPFRAGALTIPIHPDAKHREASDFSDLFMVKPKGGNALLVRDSGNKFDIMFVLVKQVKQKATPFMRPGMASANRKIRSFAKRFEV